MGYWLGQGTNKPIVFDIGGVKQNTIQPMSTAGSVSGGPTSSGSTLTTQMKKPPGMDDPNDCEAQPTSSDCRMCCDRKFQSGTPEHADCQSRCTQVDTEPGGGSGGGGGDDGGGEDGNGPAYEGCAKGKYYATNKGTCVGGYVYVGRATEGKAGRCECQKWCVDINCGSSCTECGGGGNESTLGEYEYPDELKKLFASLTGRAGEYLNKKPGFGSSLLDSMFGQNYDAVRGAGKLSQDQLLASLQSAGMLDTGAGNLAMTENAWNTEKNVGDTIRQVQIANEEQKRKDLAEYTKLASDLTGQGVTFEQIKEAINSSRRGESLSSMALMIQYLTSLMNSWGQ